ncbi:hypothetical protein BSKO_04155 [Bryopsis sp. KO-2023]|nr:hypothetical protein BSKO_04155 [Bryopsis sp. KO-2023]
MSFGRFGRSHAAFLLLIALWGPGCWAETVENIVAQPGGAGHSLVFHDNVVVKTDFKDFPHDRLTFEAWLSTSDFCHTGAIVSYAIETKTKDMHEKTRNYNHFVVFDPKNVLACRDFEFIDIVPDFLGLSCHAHYNKSEMDLSPTTANFVERDGRWHHLAVTWSAEKTHDKNGETIIYMDGMQVGKAQSGRTTPLQKGGALMLGGEQDCFGGCTDPHQGFYGMMDEVRIWKSVRTQEEIIKHMRLTGGDLDGNRDLVAYWKFDDPGTEGYESSGIARDSSGKGNDLDLFTPPKREDVWIISDDGRKLKTGALKFKNNYAMNSEVSTMPTRDISIEFWARGGNLTGDADPVTNERYSEFLSFATQSYGDGNVENDFGFADSAFMDDAIRIERYLTEYNRSDYLKNTQISTKGAISVHINANRQGNGKHEDNWLDFATNWVDDQWHHLAITWEYESGNTNLYFDGEKVVPFWRAVQGEISDEDPSRGGVDSSLAPRVERKSFGSLVFGQNQECYGGCFSPSAAYDGYLADIRIWDRVLDGNFIAKNMYAKQPANSDGLAMHYKFHKEHVKGSRERNLKVTELQGRMDLSLGSIAPSFQYSDAPLTNNDGTPLPKPSPGKMGHALKLHDRQVLMLHDFHDFPSKEITVEFWMWSIDTCREGVPFSYASGDYQSKDNTFLVFNYNNWGVAIMEDEGTADDHNAGFGSTDGRWHHIAVTWSSKTGQVTLYDNGRPQWVVKRYQGGTIPSGGTLVIGREQDCPGGCFDSAPGAAGDIQPVTDLEYGPQDYFGIIEEMRVWKRVRDPSEIYKSMKFDSDTYRGEDNFDINRNDRDLVAWWKFDEGQGYSVKDETGRGHTLRLLEEPDWVVAKWLASCGDGVMEGGEECDDGNKQNGDGCDRDCQIEDGWICDAVSPSMCRPVNSKQETGKNANNALDRRSFGSGKAEAYGQLTTRAESSGGSKKKAGSSVATVFIVLLCLVIVAFIVFVAYRKRETIYEYVPAVEDFVHASKARVGRAMGSRRDYNTLSTLDPQLTDVAPEFIDSQHPAAYQPPGRPGPYEPIPDDRR